MKEYRFYQNLCNAILAGKFKYGNYTIWKRYHQGTICINSILPEGTVVLNVQFDDDRCGTIVDKYPVREVQIIPAYAGVLIDGFKWQDVINILYLYDEGITLDGDRQLDVVRRLGNPVWKEHPRSVELETYTDAGEDMFIDLEEPTRDQLEEYVRGFDVDYNVSLWWRNGEPHDGVPFNHMSEHIHDYEKYLRWLLRVAKKMPY